MILRLSLDLPEDERYIRTARLLSRALLEDIKVTAPIIMDVENIIGELCGNVIRHAQSKASHFQVILEYYEPKVVITVTDTGKGFVKDDVPPVGQLRSNGTGGKRVGGYGMIMLEGLSDKLDFIATIPQGTTVRIEKNLTYETKLDADQAAIRDAENSTGTVAATL